MRIKVTIGFAGLWMSADMAIWAYMKAKGIDPHHP